MKLFNIKYLFVAALLVGFVSCNNDDDREIIITDDVIINPGDDNTPPPGDDGMMTDLDFSGTFSLEDQMGRAAINTVLSADDPTKDSFNLTIPSEMVDAFQPAFLAQAAGLHAAFGVEYEVNILGLDAPTLTTVLAADVLQIAPDGPTTYFDGSDPDNPVVLTGRNLTDDVVDVSLILLFGGMDGMRFNGQDLDDDGIADLPILVTDNVPGTGVTPSSTFPYLEGPL